MRLVDADPEADARAPANAVLLRDDLKATIGRRALLIVKDPLAATRATA